MTCSVKLEERSTKLSLRLPELSSVFLGLDLSLTSTGVAVIDGQRVLTGRMQPSKKLDGPDRLLWFSDNLDSVLAEYAPAFVAVEGYSFNSRARQHSLGELGGVVRLLLRKHKYSFVVVPPTTLKKFITGNGQADKSVVVKELFRRYSIDVPSNDEADATGLALVASLAFFKESRVAQQHKDIIAKIESF